ncbi:unnamed protein product, partial [Prorocentrum cordatum]
SHPSPTAAVSARGSVFFSCGGRRSPRALPAWQQRPMDLPRARPEAPGDGARLQAFTLVRRGDAEALELLLSTVEPSVWGAWRDFAGATLYQVAEDSAGRRGGGAARCLELLGARLRALGFEEVRRPRVPYRDVVEEVPAVGVERGLDVGVPEVQFHKTLRHHGAPKGAVPRRGGAGRAGRRHAGRRGAEPSGHHARGAAAPLLRRRAPRGPRPRGGGGGPARSAGRPSRPPMGNAVPLIRAPCRGPRVAAAQRPRPVPECRRGRRRELDLASVLSAVGLTAVSTFAFGSARRPARGAPRGSAVGQRGVAPTKQGGPWAPQRSRS